MAEYSRLSPIGGGTPIHDPKHVTNWTKDGFLTEEDAVWLSELCYIMNERYPNRQRRQRYDSDSVLSLWDTVDSDKGNS